MTNPQNLSEALTYAVKNVDSDRIRAILDSAEYLSFTSSSNDGSPLHLICDLVKGHTSDLEWDGGSIDLEKVKLIIYMLIDSGIDTEIVDKSGNTCLFYAVKNESAYICDILLQCGADMWSLNELLKFTKLLTYSAFACDHFEQAFIICCYCLSCYSTYQSWIM
ncbi:hypothetical protein JTE90_026172 [Oedothorax gibbosus]|uniref:Ankyrin repeat protein n=1 Tax=Oedothorax gibbosus TaxID=931172 RepID=A0AAV6UF69_9ARAC|nr:hypothetical protein JTE90_026172 [Oedothorax gibbosus]